MRAIIHIGMEKTGSSSIQVWLRSNRAALESLGIHQNKDVDLQGGYRGRAIKHAIFHVALEEMGVDEKMAWMGPIEKMRKERNIYENYKLLTDHLEKLNHKEPGTFIYSMEGLYNCNKIQIIALDKFLSRFFDDRTYVVYIRNTVDFLVSMYSQKIRSNQNSEYAVIEYHEFIKLCACDLAPYGTASSFGNLFDWQYVVDEKLNVRLLESDWLVNGDLIEDFASIIGVAPIFNPGRMYQAIAAEYVEYLRFLNREYRDNLPRKIRRRVVEILANASSGKPKLSASDAQAKSIRELHREQEERIREKFFPDRPMLFSAALRGVGVSPAPLTLSRKAEIESLINEKMAPDIWAPHELARKRKNSRILL